MSRKAQYHDSSALGLDFTNSSIVVFDRQFEYQSKTRNKKHSLITAIQNKKQKERQRE